jgi:hypothetical protein
MKTKLGLNALTAIVLFLFSVSFVVVSEVGASGKSGKENILAAYGKLPLNFIENKGQLDSKVRFYVKTSAQTLYFTDEAIVFDLFRSENAAGNGTISLEKERLSPEPKTERLVFNLGFENVRQGVLIKGLERQAGEINFFAGNDRSRWKTGIPVYKGIVYKEIYKGIDLKIFGNGRDIEYEFIVKPGGNPDDILLTYNGIKGLHKNDEGELLISTAFGQLKETRPFIYQEITGRTAVDGKFEIRSPADQSQTVKYSYGFEVAAYDPAYPLIIDPVLSYSTYLGGSNGSDLGKAIAVDSSGNAYITGYTSSTNFPLRNQVQTYQGGYDAFVTKLSSAGNALSYSTYLGGSDDDDYGTGIAVDATGNAYVTGYTYSTNFPVSSTPFQAASGGWSDAFVTKLSSAGALSYSTYLGGTLSDFGYGIAVDATGNAYVTGNTASTNFPTENPFQGASGRGVDPYFGTGDAFVTKFASDGSSLVYSTYLGGDGVDFGYGIAVDTSGNAYVTGSTTSPAATIPFPTQTAYQSTLQGSTDAFVTKLVPAGNALSFSTYLGGTKSDTGYGIALNGSGSAYVTGNTLSNDFPTVSPYQATVGGNFDAFVTKLVPAGNALSFSTYLGGSESDVGYGIAVDMDGRVYVGGTTSSGNFPTKDPFQGSLVGPWPDAFITKLSVAGTALSYSSYLGGSGSENGNGIAVDPAFGYAYLTGYTDSTDFPTQTAYQSTLQGSTAAFITKANTIPPCPECTGHPMSLTNADFPSGTECECADTTKITVGPGVIVRSGAKIIFTSPVIDYKPGVDIKPGAIVRTRH